MATTAILCIARNETPFTEEWLEYHFKIGFDRVYYVSTDSDFASVKSFFADCRYRSRVELLHFDDFKPGWQMECYNAHFPLVSEDWVLVINLDEFLYLNSFVNIQDFINNIDDDIGQVQFPWLIQMSDEYCHDRTFDILGEAANHVSDHVKSMVRRRNSTGLGIHSHGVHQLKNCLSSGTKLTARPRHSFLLNDPQYYSNHPFVLHFWSRGHFDVLNRIIDQQFFNSKCGQLEKKRACDYLLNNADWSTIPTRYLLMQFYSSLPTASVEIPAPVLNSKTDVLALKRKFVRNLNNIVDFDVADLDKVEEVFEDRFRFTQKLQSQNSLTTSNLDDYQKYATQEEYIDKLRRSQINRSEAWRRAGQIERRQGPDTLDVRVYLYGRLPFHLYCEGNSPALTALFKAMEADAGDNQKLYIEIDAEQRIEFSRSDLIAIEIGVAEGISVTGDPDDELVLVTVQVSGMPEFALLSEPGSSAVQALRSALSANIAGATDEIMYLQTNQTQRVYFLRSSLQAVNIGDYASH